MPKLNMQIQLVLTLSTLRLLAAVTSNQAQYQLTYTTTPTKIIFTCRYSQTADELNVQEVSYWLNRSAEYNQDLREREDFGTVEIIGCCSIKFNLSQSLEGYYTCGRSSEDGVQESPQLILISRTAPLHANICTNFTGISGGTAILDCPNKPGALLQYYSARWTKNSTEIASFSASASVGFRSTDPRYNIDRSTFALIISSVNFSDSGKGYQCEVYVTNPSGNIEQLPTHNDSITLHINGKPRISPTTTFITDTSDEPSFNCTVEHTGPAPNITWLYISRGVETNIDCKDPNYKIAQYPSRRENGRSILHSTLTFLNLDMGNTKIVVVRCRSGPDAKSDAYLVITTVH